MRSKPSLMEWIKSNQPPPESSQRADISKKRCKCRSRPKLETFGKRKYIKPFLSLPTTIRNKLVRWVFSSSCIETCRPTNISSIKMNQACPRSLIRRQLWRSKLSNEGTFWINLFWMWVNNKLKRLKRRLNRGDRIRMGHRLSQAEAARVQSGSEMFRLRLQV